MTRNESNAVDEADEDSSSSNSPAMLPLDQLLLEVGCFDKACRPENLERICKFAVEPFDPTAKVIIAKNMNNNNNNNNNNGDNSSSNESSEEEDNGEAAARSAVEGGAAEDRIHNNSISTQWPQIQDALNSNLDAGTLFLHNFIEPKRKRRRQSNSSINDTATTTLIAPPLQASTVYSSNIATPTSTTSSSSSSSLSSLNSISSYSPSSSVRQLCLSHCTVHAETISHFLATLKHLKVLIVWNCTVLQGLERLTSSLEGLVLVDCCISQMTLEQILLQQQQQESQQSQQQQRPKQQNQQKLERFALIRSGNLPNLQQRSSYYVSNPSGFSQALRQTSTTSIRTLVLGDSMLPDPDFAETLLHHCPQLETLSLKQTLLSDVFATALARALAETTTLKELILEQVRWSPTGAVVLADAIRTNTSLENLDLSQTLWFGPHPVNALKQMLQENKCLETVQLNRLEYSSLLCSLGAVLEGIAQNEHLIKISLAGNHLDVDAMNGLERILRGHVSLKDLSLCDCYATNSSGWEPVLLALAHNTQLERLSLEDCRIGDVAARAIGTILRTNTTLQLLDLCHNDIDEDVSFLVDGLRQNQTLTRIFLHGNELDGRKGSELLRDVIRDSNFSLRVIFLPTSPLQEEMQYYGSINYAGRKYIGMNDNQISFALWPNILARVSQRPDMLAYLLQRKPELCQREQQHHTAVQELEGDDIVMKQEEEEEEKQHQPSIVGGRKRSREEISD